MTVVYNLQACPFCLKREATMHRFDEDFFVACDFCTAAGPCISEQSEPREQMREQLAARAWNRVPRGKRGAPLIKRLHKTLGDI